MNYYDVQQQGAWSNPQIGSLLNPQMMPQFAQAFSPGVAGSAPQGMFGGMFGGLGQAAYGQPYGQFGYGQQQPFGGPAPSGGWGMQQTNGWNPWSQQQRQLSQQDVGEVVRQLLPILPQILAQAQPQTIGYAAYGTQQRQLTPQDVNEVVRQLLPVVPQIVAALQGQPQLQHAAMYGGSGAGQLGQGGLQGGLQGGFAPHYAQHLGSALPIGQSFQQQPPFQQQSFGQPGWPNAQAAFGGQGAWGSQWGQPQQRQLSQQDVTEVTRQLVGLIPQVIGNLQAYNQQRPI
jgi:hypothetical protein